MFNRSTIALIKRSMKKHNRQSLLRRGTSLYCAECQTVAKGIDVFPDRTVKLACGHRRPVANRTDDEVALFERAQQRRPVSRIDSASQRLEVVYEMEGA